MLANLKFSNISTQKNTELPIIEFYLSRQPDNRGRMINDILSWNFEQLEYVHNYIQWLFPLQERSASNPSAPLISNEEIQYFRSIPALRAKLLESFSKLLKFYGFVCREKNNQIEIIRSDNFIDRSHNWLTKSNHNFLRITRILKCLQLLGLEDYVLAFMNSLEKVYEDYNQVIGEGTINYWRRAVCIGV